MPNLVKIRIMGWRRKRRLPSRFDGLSTLCFYFAMLRRARYCHDKSSVCLSVYVTFRYRGLEGSNSSKKISRLISPGFRLSGDPDIIDLLQKYHPQILAGIGGG